jgi:predicted nucleotidyltransferase
MTLRQEGVIARFAGRIEASPVLAGAILIGSFAADTADEVSDVDVIVVVDEGRFDEAWEDRSELEGSEALVAWDVVDSKHSEIGGHKWLTADMVLVDCLVATPSSRVRLADPFRVLAGDVSLSDRLTHRQPIARAEVEAFAEELEAAGSVHDTERAYHALVKTIRAARS